MLNYQRADFYDFAILYSTDIVKSMQIIIMSQFVGAP